MADRPAFAPWMNDTNDVIKEFLAAGRVPGLINLAGGIPSPEVWPVEDIAEIAKEAVLEATDSVLNYSPIDGLPELRDAIAEKYSQGNLCLSRENVLITTAGTQGLSLVRDILLEDGGIVACQTPAYLGALDAWRTRRPTYRPMALERNDLDMRAAFEGAQFGYVVPNFSNPSGRLVERTQREDLLGAAEATGTWLIEDDPYSDLVFDGAPLPSLLELSATGEDTYRGTIIYMSTISKMLAPGLRVGWVIAAPEIVAAMTAAKQGSDMFTSGLTQQVVLRAIEKGLLDAARPKMVALYKERRDALLRAMAAHLTDTFDWTIPTGGMFVWATAKDPALNTNALMRVGLEHKVCISPSSVFDPLGQDRRSVRLNFTLNPPEMLEEGIFRLKAAVQELDVSA